MKIERLIVFLARMVCNDSSVWYDTVSQLWHLFFPICSAVLRAFAGLLFASQELKGLKEGEDPEDGPGEEGVTFDVWKKTELPPPLEPVFDEVCVFFTLHRVLLYLSPASTHPVSVLILHPR